MLLYTDLTKIHKDKLLDLLTSFLIQIGAIDKFHIKGVWDGLLLHKSINNLPSLAQNEVLGDFLSFLKDNNIIEYSTDTILVAWAKEKYNVLTYKVLQADHTALETSRPKRLLNYFSILMTLQAFLKAIERNIKISLNANGLNITIPRPASEREKKIEELIAYLKQLELLNYTIISLAPYVIQVHSAIEKLTTVLTEQRIIDIPDNPFAISSIFIIDQKWIKFPLRKVKQAERPQNQTEIEKPSRQVEKIGESDHTLSIAAQSSTAILAPAETMIMTEAQSPTHKEQEKETARQQQSAEIQEEQKQQEIRELQQHIAQLRQLISERPQQLCSSSSPWGNPTGPHWLAPPAASPAENESSAVRQYEKS